METNLTKLKDAVVHEVRGMIILGFIIMLFLNSLAIFRSIILNESLFLWWRFGYNFIEGMLLAKIIMLGRMFNLGERFGDKSLVIPVVYKAFMFSIFVIAFSILEHFVIGFLRGTTVQVLWQELESKGINEIAGKSLIMFLFFILLFSFLEITRVFGEQKVYNLFFHRNKR